MPANLANQQEITIATWVYWKGGNAWQRIFDFSNSGFETMYLTPNSGSGTLRFTIKNGGAEQQLNSTVLTANVWSHVAVTLGASGARMYVNGELVDESGTVTIRPLDFKPVLNYIGHSQYASPLFSGFIDDFMVFNYALSASEITQIYTTGSLATGVVNSRYNCESKLYLWPVPADNILHLNYYNGNNSSTSTLTVRDMNGRLLMSKEIEFTSNTALDVSNLPSGVYMLKLTNKEETLMKKLVIKH